MELIHSILRVDSNLDSYWRFEGNSNDSIGSNNGSDTDISYGNSYGRFGQGALFNGTSSKITCGDVFDKTRTSNFSVIVWVKKIANTAYNQIVYTKGINQYNLAFTSSGEVKVSIPNVKDVLKQTGVDTGSGWHFWAFTHSSSDAWKLYKDGSLLLSATDTATMTVNSSDFTIGWESSTTYMNGYIDDLAMFSRVLTADEILRMYRNNDKFFQMFQ